MSTTVKLKTNGAVRRVVFKSENGIQILSASVRRDLKAILQQLEEDAECRVVVFEATGRTFIAGADLHELQTLTVQTAHKFARSGQRLFQRIAALPAVTIAAIHAPCVGGGCELALACDIRMAAESAKIGLPEVTLGLIPGWGGTVRSRRILGSAISTRIVLSGELFAAKDALHLGLVHDVVPDDQFAAALDAKVRQHLKGERVAVGLAKHLLHEGDDSLVRRLKHEARAFAACYSTPAAHEGITAFLEKRAAEWAK